MATVTMAVPCQHLTLYCGPVLTFPSLESPTGIDTHLLAHLLARYFGLIAQKKLFMELQVPLLP